MKKLSFFIALVLLFSRTMVAQVGINNDNSTPDASAGLDVNFNNKGFLPPRMTQVQRNAIASPAEGLIIICTDCGNNPKTAISIYLGGTWQLFSGFCQVPVAPAPAASVPSATQIVWNWNTVPGATGYKWNSLNNSATATDMGTVTTKTETGLSCLTAYTRYVWAYNTCGVSVPVTMTQTTLSNPPGATSQSTIVAGPTQIIWSWMAIGGVTGYKWNSVNDYASATDMGTLTQKTQSGLTCNTAYNSYVWTYNSCGVSPVCVLSQSTSLDPPVPPTAATQSPSGTQVVWNWNTVANATGYKWNTILNPNTAQDMGTATTKTETGLNCNTAYTRYAWAYNNCGVSNALTMTATTLMNPPASPVQGTHIPSQTQIIWNWNMVIYGAAGYKWNTVNDYSTATDMFSYTSKTETGLTCNTAYTRYVWAYGTCGVSAPTILTSSTLACGFLCGQTLIDSRDSKTYGTVLIGTQCWMAQNLNIGTRIAGTTDQTNNSVIEKYCYSNLDANCTAYGGLYQWAEMVQYLNGASNTGSWNPVPTGFVTGICPAGWHLPVTSEWTTLFNYVGGQPGGGGPLKETGYTHWASPNTGASNTSGFTAFAGGDRTLGGGYSNMSYWAWYYAASEAAASSGYYMQLYFSSGDIIYGSDNKSYAYSVRCLKDN